MNKHLLLLKLQALWIKSKFYLVSAGTLVVAFLLWKWKHDAAVRSSAVHKLRVDILDNKIEQKKQEAIQVGNKLDEIGKKRIEIINEADKKGTLSKEALDRANELHKKSEDSKIAQRKLLEDLMDLRDGKTKLSEKETVLDYVR